MEAEPKTLQEAIVYLSDPDTCLKYVVSRRWPNGVTLPDVRQQRRDVPRETAPLAVQGEA